MEVGEHVVGLVLQLGHCPSGARNVDAGVRRLDALVADLGSDEGRDRVGVLDFTGAQEHTSP